MASDLLTIENKFKTVDITSLVKYTKMIEDIGNLQKPLVPNYLRDFINAIDLTNSMLSSVVKMDIDADTAVKRAEAIAFLDNATAYLNDNGIKISAEARKKYVDIDSEVIRAKELKAKTIAMLTFLKNKMHIFRHAHDDVKKIGYSEQHTTTWEGF